MDTLLAARWQMTISLMFHMVFAAIGIGLPLLMVIVEWRYLRTRQEHYLELAKKWAKATGLLFAVGAVSGTALSFELGLLWPQYMELMGAVVGHIFGLEGFAFFVEAIFIGIYLYAWGRISPWAHWLAGVMIAIAGATSGVLVVGVNAWMQIPVGFVLDDAGRVLVSDPMAIYKRYGWFMMALHSTLSCYVAVAFAVAGVYAWGWLKGHRDKYHMSAIRVSLAVGGIAAIAQPISGDLLAKFVYRTQPAKFAAMEGQYETEAYAPLRIGGWPDDQNERTRFAIEIPGALSILAAHDPSTVITGLKDIPPENRPPVHLTHAAFQIMVILGVILMVVSIVFWLIYRKRGEGVMALKWMAPVLVACGPLGFIALEAGWIVTEVGRQPWVIQPNPATGYPGMRTADAVTSAAGVAELFYLFTVLYVVLGGTVILILYSLRRQRQQRRPILAPQEVPAH